MKNFWIVLILALFLLPCRTSLANESYTIGIMGYSSRVKHTNIPERALEQAQMIFVEMLHSELDTLKDITLLDPSERFSRARRDEIILQMELGDRKAALASFDVHPDYLLYGYLDNYSITHREAMFSQNYTVRSDFTVRVMDAKSGMIVATASGTGISETHGDDVAKNSLQFGKDEISEQSWHESVEKAIVEIGEKIRKKV